MISNYSIGKFLDCSGQLYYLHCLCLSSADMVMLIVSVVMDVVLLLIYSQYEADNEDLQQAEDDYVVEEQSEHGSCGHRQQSTTSVDR